MEYLRLSFAMAVAILFSISGALAQTDPDPLRFEQEIGLFQEWDSRNAFPRDAVLFLGSSSIRLWHTANAFPDISVINRGFGGAHISDVIHFIRETVHKYEPRMIVFYAGDNDVWDRKTPERVREDFETFLEAVLDARPDTQVFFLSIKPSWNRWSAWDQMERANNLVVSMAAESDRLTYVDVGSVLMGPDARPDSSLYLSDQLHLNEQGYARWESVLRPLLVGAE